MKKTLKTLLLALIFLLVALLIGVFSWLWQHNAKNISPLPIPSSNPDLADSLPDSGDNTSASNQSVASKPDPVRVCAANQMKEALEALLVSFSQRYPKTEVVANYTTASKLITDCPASQQDLMLFMQPLSAITMQSLKTSSITQTSSSTATEAKPQLPANDHSALQHSETRSNVRAFNYALFEGKRLEGVLLSDHSAAISLRNFILSSTGQDILVEHGYDNIEGYNNRVDNLFNTNSNPPADTPEEKLAEAVGE